MILLVASSKDVAGLNIAKQILNQYPSTKQPSYQENPVYQAEINENNHPHHPERRNDKCTKLANTSPPRLVVFISSTAAQAAHQHYPSTQGNLPQQN